MEWRYPTKWRTKDWWPPDEGWALCRSEAYNDKNALDYMLRVQEFETVNGVVYPRRGRLEFYLPPGIVGKSIDFEVDTIETRA